MKKSRLLIFLLLLGGLGGTAIAFQHGQQQKGALLEKITVIQACLAANNQQAAQATAATVRQISRAVARNRYDERDKAVLQESQEILSRSQTLTDSIRALKQRLRAAASEPPTGPLRHPTAPAEWKAEMGAALIRHVDDCTVFARKFIPQSASLNLSASGISGTSWLYTNHPPLAAVLASLTQLEAQVRRHAVEALMYQSQKVGSECICFDKIGAMAVATSNTVAPGATYEAALFMAQSAVGVRSKMTVNGKPVTVQPSGQGLVEFRAPLLQPGQPDTVRAHWRGTIQAQTLLADTTWQLDVPYFIVKRAAL